MGEAMPTAARRASSGGGEGKKMREQVGLEAALSPGVQVSGCLTQPHVPPRASGHVKTHSLLSGKKATTSPPPFASFSDTLSPP